MNNSSRLIQKSIKFVIVLADILAIVLEAKNLLEIHKIERMGEIQQKNMAQMIVLSYKNIIRLLTFVNPHLLSEERKNI